MVIEQPFVFAIQIDRIGVRNDTLGESRVFFASVGVTSHVPIAAIAISSLACGTVVASSIVVASIACGAISLASIACGAIAIAAIAISTINHRTVGVASFAIASLV